MRGRRACSQGNDRGLSCWGLAVYSVYLDDGSGVQLTCRRHLAKAVDGALSRQDTFRAVKVEPV